MPKSFNLSKIQKSFNLRKFCSGTTLKADMRNYINQDLQNLISPGNQTEYFDEIPLQDIIDILKKYGLILLDEDTTKLSGVMLLGNESRATFPLAFENDGTKSHWDENTLSFNQITNAQLELQWYKMASNRYEINAYVS